MAKSISKKKWIRKKGNTILCRVPGCGLTPLGSYEIRKTTRGTYSLSMDEGVVWDLNGSFDDFSTRGEAEAFARETYAGACRSFRTYHKKNPGIQCVMRKPRGKRSKKR